MARIWGSGVRGRVPTWASGDRAAHSGVEVEKLGASARALMEEGGESPI